MNADWASTEGQRLPSAAPLSATLLRSSAVIFTTIIPHQKQTHKCTKGRKRNLTLLLPKTEITFIHSPCFHLDLDKVALSSC